MERGLSGKRVVIELPRRSERARTPFFWLDGGKDDNDPFEFRKEILGGGAKGRRRRKR